MLFIFSTVARCVYVLYYFIIHLNLFHPRADNQMLNNLQYLLLSYLLAFLILVFFVTIILAVERALIPCPVSSCISKRTTKTFQRKVPALINK
jgi:small-conductance mechanosensitive channel